MYYLCVHCVYQYCVHFVPPWVWLDLNRCCPAVHTVCPLSTILLQYIIKPKYQLQSVFFKHHWCNLTLRVDFPYVSVTPKCLASCPNSQNRIIDHIICHISHVAHSLNEKYVMYQIYQITFLSID